jgi:hypothetical protein
MSIAETVRAILVYFSGVEPGPPLNFSPVSDVGSARTFR